MAAHSFVRHFVFRTVPTLTIAQSVAHALQVRLGLRAEARNRAVVEIVRVGAEAIALICSRLGLDGTRHGIALFGRRAWGCRRQGTEMKRGTGGSR